MSSPRERQVLSLLTTGLLNKQIAAELGTAEKTIESHRGHILDKMQVRNATALSSLLYRMKSNDYQVAWDLRGATDRRLSWTPAGPGMAGWLKTHVQHYDPPCCA